MTTDDEILRKAEEFLRQEVAPNAEAMDLEYEPLKVALDGLCRLDLMALKRPTSFGGPAISDAGMRHFQELIARYSGALAFLQTQHQGVVGMIASSGNQRLKDEYLPRMGDGRRLVGVGFSQLRRPGPPIMRAEPTGGGYLLEGHVPWVTGFGFYPEFMIGASLPTGESLFAPVPLTSGEGVTIGEPMKLASMTSAHTVTADFANYFVPENRVALIREAGWIQNNDQINIAQQGSFALGCAQAGLDILQRNAEKRRLTFALEAYEKLDRELRSLRDETEKARTNISDETTQSRLDLRAWQIQLAVKCAHAAVASSSGAANSLAHPAQRVYREALVFTVSAQTGPVMQATLERITSDCGE
jgi:alkylation response protein AidB-like acyl-CoA dehydrogenase